MRLKQRASRHCEFASSKIHTNDADLKKNNNKKNTHKHANSTHKKQAYLKNYFTLLLQSDFVGDGN